MSTDPKPPPTSNPHDQALASEYETARRRSQEDTQARQRVEEDRQRAREADARRTHMPPPKRTPIPLLQKVVLFGLECDVDIEAQYNPKEIQIDKTIEWKASPNKKHDKPELEFTAAKARTLSMELMFDTYEEGIDVQGYVRRLLLLSSVMKPDGNEMEKRPTLVQVRWGNPDMPIFEGVIESVSTKLTMFLPSGTPVRATCTVKMMEAQRAHRLNRGSLKPKGPATRW